jgi:AbrB family looped-hinge helix DNA binding protein
MSTLTRNGQVTIPLKIRAHLNLRAGDKVEFVVQPDGNVMIVAKNIDIRELAGMLGPTPRRLTIAQMDNAVRRRFRRL